MIWKLLYRVPSTGHGKRQTLLKQGPTLWKCSCILNRFHLWVIQHSMTVPPPCFTKRPNKTPSKDELPFAQTKNIKISPKISHPWISRKKILTTVLSFKTLPKKILSMQGNKWPKRWGTRCSHHVRLFSLWCGVFPLTIQREFCSSGCSREQIGWNSGDASVFTKIWRQHLAATLLAHLTSCKRKLPPKLHALKKHSKTITFKLPSFWNSLFSTANTLWSAKEWSVATDLHCPQIWNHVAHVETLSPL